VGDFHARVGRQSTTSVSNIVRDALCDCWLVRASDESRKYQKPSILRLPLSERDGASTEDDARVGRLRADTSAIFTRASVFQTTRELSFPATWILLVSPFRAHARLCISARRKKHEDGWGERGETGLFQRHYRHECQGEEVFVGGTRSADATNRDTLVIAADSR